MYVHVWYDCHNQKVGCREESLLSTYITLQSGNGPHSRANPKVGDDLPGWVPDKDYWEDCMLTTKQLSMSCSPPPPPPIAHRSPPPPPSACARGACLVSRSCLWAPLRLRSRADPSLKPDRPSSDQPTDDPYLSIRPASTLRASFPATLIALPKMFFMTQQWRNYLLGLCFSLELKHQERWDHFFAKTVSLLILWVLLNTCLKIFPIWNSMYPKYRLGPTC